MRPDRPDEGLPARLGCEHSQGQDIVASLRAVYGELFDRRPLPPLRPRECRPDSSQAIFGPAFANGLAPLG